MTLDQEGEISADHGVLLLASLREPDLLVLPWTLV